MVEVPLSCYDFIYVVPAYLYQQDLDPSRLLVLGLDSRSS